MWKQICEMTILKSHIDMLIVTDEESQPGCIDMMDRSPHNHQECILKKLDSSSVSNLYIKKKIALWKITKQVSDL